MRISTALLASSLIAVGMSLSGCGASMAVEAARARDIPRLQKALASEDKSGALDSGEARSVAKALTRSEIAFTKGDDGTLLVLSLSTCAPAIEGALEDRSERDDETAAAAAQVMLDSKLVDADEYVSYAKKSDPRPVWRALGARGLIAEKFVDLRRPLFRDLDERVRIGALQAAEDFSVGEDFDELLGAARLDPNPTARAAAIRALGRLGGEESVHALRDLWPTADRDLRSAIAAGWGSPKSFEAGGKEELIWAAQNDSGKGGVSAALVLAHHSAKGSPDESIALGVLEREIKLGTREDRVAAISGAPSSDTILEAVRAAKDDSDPGISIIAWSRLHTEGTVQERKDALDKVLVLAKADSPEAPRAMEELAWMGDSRVLPLLETTLHSKNAHARALAAESFAALGQLGKAARVLGDDDIHTRLDVACAILAKRN